MQFIVDFLSSQIWQGIAGIVAVIALVVSLTNPRKWLFSNPSTKWIATIPWTFLLIGLGAVIGFSVGIKNQNAYLGLAVGFSVASLGLGIQWLQSGLMLSRFRVAYDHLTHQYNDLLAIVDRLHKVEFAIIDWNISHTIDENGDTEHKEELTIVPTSEPVKYYFVEYKTIPDANSPGIEFSVRNSSDETPLSYFPIESPGNSITYMIVLDPPSEMSNPKRISISCRRKKIWKRLLSEGVGEGSINVNFGPNRIELVLMAPRDTKWKAFRPAPATGDVKLDMVGSLSRATWNISHPTLKEYNYRVFLETAESKSL